jgi:hypothetical protein
MARISTIRCLEMFFLSNFLAHTKINRFLPLKLRINKTQIKWEENADHDFFKNSVKDSK